MYKCPKCSGTLQDYISFLAPTYKTFMCFGCGSIFYDLVDQNQLQQITANVLVNVAKRKDELQAEVNKRISKLQRKGEIDLSSTEKKIE